MNTYKLLPCPFCGGKAEVCGYYFIQCTKCGSSTLTHTNREEAIKAWNIRKPMDDIVERLEEENSKLKTMPVWKAIEIVKEVGGSDGTMQENRKTT